MVSRRAASAAGSISTSRATPDSTVLRVPPSSWIVMVRKRSPSTRPYSDFIRPIWNTSQPRPTKSTPAMLGLVA